MKHGWTATDVLMLRAAIRRGETLRTGELLKTLQRRHPGGTVATYLSAERRRMALEAQK